MPTPNMISHQQRQALKEAAEWYTLLCDEENQFNQLGWQSWLDADSHHQWAWQQLNAVQKRLKRAPSAVALGTFERAQKQALDRRSLLKAVALFGTTGLLWGGYRQLQSHGDYVTSVGEIKTFRLADQTLLTLDTNTTIAMGYTTTERNIKLLKGRVMISTGHPAGEQRPFSVVTPFAKVTALGTRYSVEIQQDRIITSVFEKRVQLALNNTSVAHQWAAGQTIEANGNTIIGQYPAPQSDQAWAKGLLIVEDMSLTQFLTQLERYRSGIILTTPELERLRVTGTFHLNNTEQILSAVAKTFPIKVQYFTPYFIRVTTFTQ